MSLLSDMLDRVKYAKSELAIDAAGLSDAHRERLIELAKSRGLSVAGTKRWLLIRRLSAAKAIEAGEV